MGRPKKVNSQANDILSHLQKHGSITSIEAINTYGATRLAAIIYNLKKDGYHITTDIQHGTNRYGEKTHWAEYSLTVY